MLNFNKILLCYVIPRHHHVSFSPTHRTRSIHARARPVEPRAPTTALATRIDASGAPSHPTPAPLVTSPRPVPAHAPTHPTRRRRRRRRTPCPRCRSPTHHRSRARRDARAIGPTGAPRPRRPASTPARSTPQRARRRCPSRTPAPSSRGCRTIAASMRRR